MSLKRKKPLQRKTPLKRSRKPIQKRSSKRIKEDSIYYPEREKFLRDNTECVLKLSGCTGVATCIEHTAGRGINYLDKSTWIASCANCNLRKEEKPEEAKNKGVSQSRLSKDKIDFTNTHNEPYSVRNLIPKGNN